MAKSNSILCDHKCPVHEKCARYLEGLVRRNTYHIYPMPYGINKKEKCGYFEKIEAFDNLIKPD